MSDAASKPRWYHITPDRFLIGLLAAVLLVLLADRLELLGLSRGSGWNVLLAMAVASVGILGGLIWCGASLLLRRRFRFGLKSLLGLAVVVAILCSWFTVKMQQANRQKKAVKAIQGLGGNVWYEHEVDRSRPLQPLRESAASRIAVWCRNLLGPDFLSHVVKVSPYGTEATDAALVHLKELTSLVHLDLSGTQVTDAGLVHLKELTSLKDLNLSGTQVSDAGLVHLKELTDLEALALCSIQVTNDGLMHLKELTNLRWLYLRDTRVTDAGLVHLKGLANLERLWLGNSQVADAGLVHLKELTNLKGLYLDGTQVTDDGLVHLEELTNLEWLWIPGTQVTDDGVEKLQRALPNCEIQ